jgi:hypothetical protein
MREEVPASMGAVVDMVLSGDWRCGWARSFSVGRTLIGNVRAVSDLVLLGAGVHLALRASVGTRQLFEHHDRREAIVDEKYGEVST